MKRLRYTGDLIKDAYMEMEYSKHWIAKRTCDKMYDLLLKAYNKMLDDFYSRKPQSPYPYIRHDIGLNKTLQGKGKNLYKAALNKSRIKPADNQYDGSLYFDSSLMSSSDYRIDTGNPESVLKTVLGYDSQDAYRFPIIREGYSEADWNKFIANYSVDNDVFKGSPIKVLEDIRDSMSEKLYKDAIKDAKKELKLKYVNIE